MRQRKLRVFVAGPYSGTNVLSVLGNIGRGYKGVAELFAAGFTPYNPWADCVIAAMYGEHIPVQEYKAASMAWLEVSDAVLLMEGWENSAGTQDEIKCAHELGIPVFTSLVELDMWAADQNGEAK